MDACLCDTHACVYVALEKWFGDGRNHIRDRAIMLVENGHVNMSTLRVMTVKKKISGEDVYLLEAKVVASQKGQWYLSRVAIADDWKTLLGRPYSSCECVARCGPADSHQLALLLMVLTARIIMGRLPDKSWATVREHLPPYILVMQKVPMTVRYAYGPGSMARFKGTSPGHTTALLKLKSPMNASDNTVEAVETEQVAIITTPATASSDTQIVGAQRAVKRKRKGTPCSYVERCTAAGHPKQQCSAPGCANRCHEWCSRMFGAEPGQYLCPLHSHRATTTTNRKTRRDYSKGVLHLPTVWADCWANIKPETSEIVNEARMTVSKIRADTDKEVAYFPRDWRAQHACDLMNEREFALLVAKKVNKDDLWSNFLVLTRAKRLERMRTAELRMRQEERQVPVDSPPPPRRKQRVNKVRVLCKMLPGKYIVTQGRDRGDRLIVRETNGSFNGYYVYARGQVAQNADPFSIEVSLCMFVCMCTSLIKNILTTHLCIYQVGRKGACTLLSIAVLNDSTLSQFAKDKHIWTLDRKKSRPSALVWTQKTTTRRRESGKIKVRVACRHMHAPHSLTRAHTHNCPGHHHHRSNHVEAQPGRNAVRRPQRTPHSARANLRHATHEAIC